MRKSLNMDHKSNLNTSCASDLQSSMLSSVHELNIDESLAKVNQLKKLYFQTCEEEVCLQNENGELNAMLKRLKAELEELIDNKFGSTRIKKQQALDPRGSNERPERLYKPGSITKINKRKDGSVSGQTGKGFERASKREPTFHQDSEFQFGSPKGLDNRSCQEYPTESLRGEQKITFQMSSDFDLPQEKSKMNRHRYKRSMDIQINRQMYSNDGIMTQREEIQKAELVEAGKRKSYLNSPRTSALNSPRGTLIR